MAIAGIDPKCYILALFVRDDGVRFLLGDDPYEFKDKQLHFQPNTVANDVVEVQGNDGYLLAGQVRRPGTQSFDGYVCNGTNSKTEVEVKRREFLQFFRRSHFYKVIYVFPNGTAIQRKQGFLVDDPTVQELYQQYPEYHVALNFEDVNYYTYEEDDQGQEIYAKEAIVPLAGGGATGGLIWDEYGVVWEDPWSDLVSVSGSEIQIDNEAGARASIQDLEIQGDTHQQTYSGKNKFNLVDRTSFGITGKNNGDGTVTISGTATNSGGFAIMDASQVIPAGTYTLSISKSLPFLINLSITGGVSFRIPAGDTSATTTLAQSYSTAYLFMAMTSGTTYNETFGIQLVAGSTPDYNFEPYVGGIPSPNPDYPQAVQTVTGEQTVTVNGKNLLNLDSVLPTVNPGLNIVEQNSNNLLLEAVVDSGNYNNANYRLNLRDIGANVGETYTISADISGAYTGANGASIRILKNNSAAGNDILARCSGEPATFTIPEGTTSIGIFFYVRQGSAPAIGSTASFTNIQLERNDSATVYESYKGIQAYIVDLRGKNILNISDFEMGGLSNGNPTPSTFRINNALHAIAVQPNTTYTLSAQLVSPVQGFRVGIHEIDRNGVFLRDLGWKQLGTGAFTMTTNSDTYYLKIVGSLSTTSTNVTTGGTENTTACTTVTEFMRGCTLMLEKGSTATTYEPSNPIELCKIGNYQDYIYNSGDDWYVHKETKKVIYDGSEGWVRSTYEGTNNFYILDSDAALVGGTSLPPIFSDMFTRKAIADCWNMGNEFNAIAMYNNSGQIRVFFPQSLANTVDAFKSWLNTHNVVAYYAIATPTDTKITDATLIGQLEALGAMRLFIGENNLLVSANGTNLPATLEFSYPTKFAAIGAEWEEGGTKGATIVDVNAIDNTYPVWELMGPAVNPTISVLTTNTTLTYNGTITASQKLVIDMFNKTATLNGTSVIGNVSGDFVYMAPGTNRIAYTAGNTDAPDSTIYWQEVVG